MNGTMRKFILAAALLAATSAPAVAAPSGIFGTNETRHSTIGAFRKWTDMLARNSDGNGGSIPARKAAPAGGGLPQSGRCLASSPADCARPTWPKLIESLRGLDRRAQIETVNRELNRIPYILDKDNWGVSDYWATAEEFLEHDGDCEDYAIAKYMALKAVGVPASDMRIVVLQDLNLGIAHAVLAVRHGTQWLILDNQIKEVMPDKAIVHYRPIYSINEQHWWLHQE